MLAGGVGDIEGNCGQRPVERHCEYGRGKSRARPVPDRQDSGRSARASMEASIWKNEMQASKLHGLGKLTDDVPEQNEWISTTDDVERCAAGVSDRDERRGRCTTLDRVIQIKWQQSEEGAREKMKDNTARRGSRHQRRGWGRTQDRPPPPIIARPVLSERGVISIEGKRKCN